MWHTPPHAGHSADDRSIPARPGRPCAANNRAVALATMARAMRRRSTSRGANLAAWLYTFGAVAILAASTGLGDHSVVEFLSAFSQFFSFAAWGYFAYRVARWFLPSIVGVRRPPLPRDDAEEERYYD